MCAETDTLVHEKTKDEETQKRYQSVTDMWNAGYTGKQIGAALHISTRYAYEIIDILSLPNRAGQWTMENLRLFKQAWAEGKSGLEIGKKLGFSKNAIHGAADRHGLTKRPRNNVGRAVLPEETIAEIKQLHQDGLTLVQIGQRVGRCKHAVQRVIGPQGRWPVSGVVKRIERSKEQARASLERKRYFAEQWGSWEKPDPFKFTGILRYNGKPVRIPIPAHLPPKNPRRCAAVDGPRFKQVQCEGFVADLRDAYCPECKAKFQKPLLAKVI